MIVGQFNTVEFQFYVVGHIDVNSLAIGGTNSWQCFVLFIPHVIQINLDRCANGRLNLYTTHIDGFTIGCSHAVDGLEKVVVLTENNNRVFIANLHLQIVAIKTTTEQGEDIE